MPQKNIVFWQNCSCFPEKKCIFAGIVINNPEVEPLKIEKVFWFHFNPYIWLVARFVAKYPRTSLVLLALFLVGVFSLMAGWPAYVLLFVCLLLSIAAFLLMDKKIGLNVNGKYDVEELALIERKNRWKVILLSFFALIGNLVSLIISLYSIEHDSSSITSSVAMVVFQFIFICIPYFTMSLVKRKSSFWYGFMMPIFLFAIIQLTLFFMGIGTKESLLTWRLQYDYEVIRNNFPVYEGLFMAFFYHSFHRFFRKIFWL